MAEEKTADAATPKRPLPSSYYCRVCREWSGKEVCPTCSGPTVKYTQPPGTVMVIAGVWDPEDGDFHIINFDDLRNLTIAVEALGEKLDTLLAHLRREEQIDR